MVDKKVPLMEDKGGKGIKPVSSLLSARNENQTATRISTVYLYTV